MTSYLVRCQADFDESVLPEKRNIIVRNSERIWAVVNCSDDEAEHLKTKTGIISVTFSPAYWTPQSFYDPFTKENVTPANTTLDETKKEN